MLRDEARFECIWRVVAYKVLIWLRAPYCEQGIGYAESIANSFGRTSVLSIPPSDYLSIQGRNKLQRLGLKDRMKQLFDTVQQWSQFSIELQSVQSYNYMTDPDLVFDHNFFPLHTLASGDLFIMWLTARLSFHCSMPFPSASLSISASSSTGLLGNCRTALTPKTVPMKPTASRLASSTLRRSRSSPAVGSRLGPSFENEVLPPARYQSGLGGHSSSARGVNFPPESRAETERLSDVEDLDDLSASLLPPPRKPESCSCKIENCSASMIGRTE